MRGNGVQEEKLNLFTQTFTVTYALCWSGEAVGESSQRVSGNVTSRARVPSQPRSHFAGFYCSTRGRANYTAPCKNGSFCPPGSQIPAPQECHIGFHCPEGSDVPKPCPAGSFTNASGRGNCEICPAGFYCVPLELDRNESIGYHICPRGYYCPAGTGLDWKPCPAGTYSDKLGLHEKLQCQDCDSGKYCPGTNLTSPTDYCHPGYFCTIGGFLFVARTFSQLVPWRHKP